MISSVPTPFEHRYTASWEYDQYVPEQTNKFNSAEMS